MMDLHLDKPISGDESMALLGSGVTLQLNRALPQPISEDVQNMANVPSASSSPPDGVTTPRTELPVGASSSEVSSDRFFTAPDGLPSTQAALAPAFSVINMRPARKRAAPSNENLQEPAAKRVVPVASICAADGMAIAATKKQRKVRSDKGKRRRPRKNTDVQAETSEIHASGESALPDPLAAAMSPPTTPALSVVPAPTAVPSLCATPPADPAPATPAVPTLPPAPTSVPASSSPVIDSPIATAPGTASLTDATNLGHHTLDASVSELASRLL